MPGSGQDAATWADLRLMEWSDLSISGFWIMLGRSVRRFEVKVIMLFAFTRQDFILVCSCVAKEGYKGEAG